MRRCKCCNDELIPLPEPLIQHIQSFLTGKEAARTTFLSKSWYTAWLTRPTFDFDQNDFIKVRSSRIGFAEAMTKNMQRYQDSNMKIDNFRLKLACCYSYSRMRESEILTSKLIVSALKMGATDLDLDLHSAAFVLPREVLESEQLVRLSLSKRTIDGNVRCWRLKSLILHRVHLGRDDIIRDILSCCLLIEELSLSFCTRPSSGVRKNSRSKMIDLSGMNMFRLHKLRRLCLKKVKFDRLFFSDFSFRFPCLKDLSISECCCNRWSEAIRIASTSLESISFVKVIRALTAEFDVPNLVSFRYSGEGVPSLRIESSREWESDVSIEPVRYAEIHSNSWYLRLKKMLTQLRPSNISLCISKRYFLGEDTDFKAVPTPLVVENLTIDIPCWSGYTILSGLLRICRPKFLTIYWFTPGFMLADDNNLCKRVMEEIITPNCEISDQNMFGQLGLKEASAEVEERLGGQWQPLLLSDQQLDALTSQAFKQKLRFRLRWG